MGFSSVCRLQRRSLFSSLLLLSSLSLQACAQICYNQNDSVDPPSIPCYPSNSTGTSQSFCCPVGRTCYTNGLCGPSNTDPNYGRLSCTDPTWRSPDCPQFCLSNDQAGGAVVVLCPGTDNQYCCSNLARDDNQTYGCCDDSSNFLSLGALVEVANGTGTTASSSSATSLGPTSTASSTLSKTATSVAAATSSATSPHSSGSTSSTAVGVGVGVGIAAVLFISVGVFLLVRRRRAKQRSKSSQFGPSADIAEAPPGYVHHDVKHELSGGGSHARSLESRIELDSRPDYHGEAVELPARG